MKKYICDCGHKESKHSEITRGYSTDQNGKTRCYPCSLKGELAEIEKTGRVVAYHSSDNRITDWVGQTISDEVLVLSIMRDNFGGERHYLRFSIGSRVFSGFSMGKGMYLRAKATQMKSVYDR